MWHLQSNRISGGANRREIYSFFKSREEAMISSIEDFRKGSWGVHPELAAPDLFPPAVMFSIFDSDPRSKFRDTLHEMSAKQNEQVFDLPPGLTQQLMRQGLLSAAWDGVFHEVRGDKIGLLSRNESSQTTSEAARANRAYAVMIKSTEPPGRKWLVTRTVQHEGKAVCWCIPVDVQSGTTVNVSLTLENMIALEMN